MAASVPGYEQDGEAAQSQRGGVQEGLLAAAGLAVQVEAVLREGAAEVVGEVQPLVLRP